MGNEIVINQDYKQSIENALKNSAAHIDLPVEALARMTLKRITTKKGQEPTILQVVELIKTAVDMGLDPTSKDIFSFVSGDTLSVGISKGGWEKAVEIKGGSFTFQLGPVLPPLEPNLPASLMWAKCIITRRDGSVVEGIPAFDDECNKHTGVWVTMPKHMLMVRAFTNAAKAAYGFGAYTIEEAKAIFEQTPARAMPPIQPAVASTPRPALPEPKPAAELSAEQLTEIKGKFEAATTRDELKQAFIALPVEQRHNPQVIELSKEVATKLQTNPTNEEVK